MVITAIGADAAIGKLPADKAGTISPPNGKIGFIRDGNIWIMDAGGGSQEMICQSGNAGGRMSWSPDGRKIIFTRSGMVTVRQPDNMGGSHKVYDLFLAYIDSAYNGNSMHWMSLTNDLGSRDPEWSADGKKITFFKDIKGNQVNSFMPNYQICTMDSDGENFQMIRKDWQNFYDEFIMDPTMNAAGEIAAVYFFQEKKQGLVVLKPDEYMMSLDSIKARAMNNRNLVAPAWSPDGKWIAYISNNLNDAGLYITTSDFSERYLVLASPVGTYLNTYAPSFSPDGKWITISTTDGSIWIVDITGNGARRLSGPGLDAAPAWSKGPVSNRN